MPTIKIPFSRPERRRLENAARVHGLSVSALCSKLVIRAVEEAEAQRAANGHASDGATLRALGIEADFTGTIIAEG